MLVASETDQNDSTHVAETVGRFRVKSTPGGEPRRFDLLPELLISERHSFIPRRFL